MPDPLAILGDFILDRPLIECLERGDDRRHARLAFDVAKFLARGGDSLGPEKSRLIAKVGGPRLLDRSRLRARETGHLPGRAAKPRRSL